jgi:hypothetical protein
MVNEAHSAIVKFDGLCDGRCAASPTWNEKKPRNREDDCQK